MRTASVLGVLIVVALVVVLAAMIWPAFERVRNGPRDPCIRHLKQLGLGMKEYAVEYGDSSPWEAASLEHEWTFLGKLYPTYIEDPINFTCPVSKDRKLKRLRWKKDEPFASFRESDVISYAYGIDASDPQNPAAWTENARSTVRILADKKAGTRIGSPGNPVRLANHEDDGRNVLYNDGHVKWKPGPDALDPDEEQAAIGPANAADYSAWWSDPPYYGE